MTAGFFGANGVRGVASALGVSTFGVSIFGAAGVGASAFVGAFAAPVAPAKRSRAAQWASVNGSGPGVRLKKGGSAA
jgi:hypothetical protein